MSSLELYPYQVEGARFLSDRNRAAIFDVPGLGKTPQLIRALDNAELERGIVVVPAMLRENWKLEFERFATHPRSITKVRNNHDFNAWLTGRFDVAIMSYEQAVKWEHDIAEPLDFLVVDEAHYAKNQNTKRTRALFGNLSVSSIGGIAGWCGHVWLATGTPIPNDPIDIYTLLRATGAIECGQRQFQGRYFRTQQSLYSQSNRVRSPAARRELIAMIENVSIRRTKDEVGLQLPPISFDMTVLDGDSKPILDMLADHPDLEQEILKAVNGGNISFIIAPYIATLRRLVGVAKSIPYSRMLKMELQGTTDKRVVFGLHKQPLAMIHEAMQKAGIGSRLVTGDTSEPKRVEAVHAFMNDPECRVFIANIRTAGTGLTLTSACEVDMVEVDWVPASNAQAIMRVHRISQERQVRARFITLADSIDVRVNQTLARKSKAIAEVGDADMVLTPP